MSLFLVVKQKPEEQFIKFEILRYVMEKKIFILNQRTSNKNYHL